MNEANMDNKGHGVPLMQHEPTTCYDAAMRLCLLESSTLHLKGLLCDGSMLKGYTAKPLTEVDLTAVKGALERMAEDMIALALELQAIGVAVKP